MRWEPWQELHRLQREMEALLRPSMAGRGVFAAEYPPINLTRDDQGISVEALVPGVDKSGFDISVVGDTVTIRGERKPEPNVPEDRYDRRERPMGAFTRTLSVGEHLDAEHTEATYQNGVLRIRLARAPEAVKKIPIKTGE
jgi:HSP20 family protein